MTVDLIKEYLRPELLILVPVMYLIGAIFKAFPSFPDKWIPLTLGALGAGFSLLYLAATTDISGLQDILGFIFSGLTQGILAAGASVYINQIAKQGSKDE